MNSIGLLVSGERREVMARSVAALLAELELSPDGRGIAIAVNDTVVSKSRWNEHELKDGDTVEIVKAVQGG